MRRRDDGDDDSLPVMVPRSDEVLVPISAEPCVAAARAPDQGIAGIADGETLGMVGFARTPGTLWL